MSAQARPTDAAVKALLVVPLPCDVLLFGKLLTLAARRWETDHPGRKLTMDHLETKPTEFGEAAIVWDEPLPPPPERT